MSFRKYIFAVFAMCLAMAAAVVGLVALVDPYRINGTSLILAANAPRPTAHNHASISKARLALRLQPKTIMIGNSRIDVGFSPASSRWPSEMAPVFNFGLPGVGLLGCMKSYLSIHPQLRPARLIIGLDFVDFLRGARGTLPLSSQPSPALVLTVRQAVETHASLQALHDAVFTLVKQYDPQSDDMTIQGFNPLRSYALLARLEGYSGLFAQKNVEYARRLSALSRQSTDPTNHPLMNDLEFFLNKMSHDEVETKLIIYPYHADFLETIRALGLWREFENWKSRLTTLVADANLDQGKPWVQLWDFARYDNPTVEIVPAPADRKSEMKYYWESGHFKPALGDLVIARIFGDQTIQFGIQLTPASVATELAKDRARQIAYRIKRPSEVARVEAVIREVGARAQRSLDDE